MTTTWDTRLTGGEGRDLRLYFTIQGVPDVFQTDVEDVPTTLEPAARPRRKVIKKGGIQQSPTVLNLAERRVEGATMTVELVDDDDGTLTALFKPRQYRATFIRANTNTTTTTVSVNDTSLLDDAGVAYVDAETIAYESSDPNDLLTCTRGAHGSVAQAHFGTSAQGAAVFTAPPAWKGRRVYLSSYFLKDDGTTSSPLSRAEGTFRIEKAPIQTESGAWLIQCSELGDEVFQRKIGRGLREVEIEPTLTTEDGVAPDSRVLPVGQAVKQFAMGDYVTQVILRNSADAHLCYDVVDVNDADAEITIAEPQRVSHPPANWGATVSVRHIAILEDTWAQMALKVLVSKLGDLTDGGFDALPGVEREAFGSPSFQMGAGIPLAEIDDTSFRAVGDLVKGRYIIDDETTVGAMLFEFSLATGSIPYFTRDGLLAMRHISSQSNATVMEVDESMLLEGSKGAVEYDEDVIAPRVNLECNYDPLTKEYAAKINTYDTELAARYPGDETTLQLQSKSIVIDGIPFGTSRTDLGVQEIQPAPESRRTFAAIEGDLRSLQVSNGRGRAYLRGRWHMDLLKLTIGDLVQLSVAAPNLEGAATINQLARCTELGPDWNKGAVDATFELVDQTFVFAPACLLESADTAILTLKTGTIEAYEPSTPGQMFADNSAVQIWDISAGTFVQRTVVSHTDTTVTISSGPGFAIEDGVDLIRHDDQTLAVEDTNQDGFTGADFTYQMNANENDFITIGGTPTRPTVSRWR